MPKGKGSKEKFVPFEKYGSMVEKYSSKKQRAKHEKSEGKAGERKEKSMSRGGRRGR